MKMTELHRYEHVGDAVQAARHRAAKRGMNAVVYRDPDGSYRFMLRRDGSRETVLRLLENLGAEFIRDITVLK